MKELRSQNEQRFIAKLWSKWAIVTKEGRNLFNQAGQNKQAGRIKFVNKADRNKQAGWKKNLKNLREHALLFTPPRTPRISGLKSQILKPTFLS